MKITVGDLEKVFGVSEQKTKGSYEVSVLSHTYLKGELHSVILRDKNQICIEFPVSIFKSNDEIIPAVGDILYFSSSRYNTWFSALYESKKVHLSAIIMKNFDKLLENSSIVLSNKHYFNLRMPSLRSHMAYAGSTSYSLGSLIQSWITETTFYLDQEGLYLISISGSPLSGAHTYTAWSHREKVFLTGTLNKTKYGTWRNYFIKFVELGRKYPGNNRSDIMVMSKMIGELKLSTD